MILVDTNVILSLIDPSADHHAAARRLAPAMRKEGLVLTLPVVAELTHFFDAPYLYDRFDALVDVLGIRFEKTEHLVDYAETLGWLKRYSSHGPDYTDAHLVLLTATVRRCRVWTFDREFRTLWRRPDGSVVPLAMK